MTSTLEQLLVTVRGWPTPSGPQPGIRRPLQGLGWRNVARPGVLFIVGAHGGAGEKTLASLDTGWLAAGHSWPQMINHNPANCVLTARTSATGLSAAQDTLAQWASSGAGTSRLLGLVLIPDAPGRLPRPLRDLAQVVAGGAPRCWTIPWVEAWRYGPPTPETRPQAVRRLVDEIRTLKATADEIPSITE